LGPDEQLITVSAGGGSFGYRILEATLKAHALLARSDLRLQLFTGPYLAEKQFQTLRKLAGPGAIVERFSSDFPAWLAAADLSVSMGGYNTTMNILAAAVPALIFPYDHDREQGLRARALSRLADLQVLEDRDLEPSRLAQRIRESLGREAREPKVRLDGARRTAILLEQLRRTAAKAS